MIKYLKSLINSNKLGILRRKLINGFWSIVYIRGNIWLICWWKLVINISSQRRIWIIFIREILRRLRVDLKPLRRKLMGRKNLLIIMIWQNSRIILSKFSYRKIKSRLRNLNSQFRRSLMSVSSTIERRININLGRNYSLLTCSISFLTWIKYKPTTASFKIFPDLTDNISQILEKQKKTLDRRFTDLLTIVRRRMLLYVSNLKTDLCLISKSQKTRITLK